MEAGALPTMVNQYEKTKRKENPIDRPSSPSRSGHPPLDLPVHIRMRPLPLHLVIMEEEQTTTVMSP
jgi:hypothetical protein